MTTEAARRLEHGIQTFHVEHSLGRWLTERIELPERYADRVETQFAGEQFNERANAWIQPRMTAIARVGPRDGDEQVLTLVVTVGVKTDPKGGLFGFLSLLVDEVRRAIDSTRRPGAMPILDAEKQEVAKLDFGPAQETRQFGVATSVGNVSIPGVDLAVLTVSCQISPARPRVRRPK